MLGCIFFCWDFFWHLTIKEHDGVEVCNNVKISYSKERV